jgi:hypothetical protein
VNVWHVIGVQHVKALSQQPNASRGEPASLSDCPSPVDVQRAEATDRVEGGVAVIDHTWAPPPLHRKDVDFRGGGKSPGQLVISDFAPAEVVGEHRIDHKRHDRPHFTRSG